MHVGEQEEKSGRLGPISEIIIDIRIAVPRYYIMLAF